MSVEETTFSINEYDHEGDEVESGIYLHFNGARIRAAESIEEFELFIDRLVSIKNEIKENHDI